MPKSHVLGPTAAAITLACLPMGPAAAQVAFTNDGATYALRNVTSLKDMPFRTVVRQQYDYSCGSAALATLLRFHYGVDVNEAEIFQAMYATGDQAKIQKVGFSLLDMKRYLEGRGYKADGYRVDLDGLIKTRTPAITLINIRNYKHFVVVKGVRDDRILVGDPALGTRIYSRAEFAKMWNGLIFAIHDTQVAGVYNNEKEWESRPRAPLGIPLGEESLAAFTRELPPVYQVVERALPPPAF